MSAPLGFNQGPFGRRLLGSTSLLRALLSEPTLNRGTKLCYLTMCAYGRDSGRCFMSAPTLAADLRCTPRQIERWWRALESAGFIRPEWRAGRPTHYTFLAHPIFGPPAKLTPDTGVTPPLTLVSPTPDTGVTEGIGLKDKEDRSIDRSIEQAGKAGVPPDSADELAAKVKAHLWGYIGAGKTGRVREPDNEIVKRCVLALNGHTVEELEALLRERFRSGCRPGLTGGPRSYAWFETVIARAFKE